MLRVIVIGFACISVAALLAGAHFTAASLSIGEIKDIVTGTAAVLAIVIAGEGLRTWRKQLKGTTEYEVAKSIVTATLKVRASIDQLRNPMVRVSKDTKEKESYLHALMETYQQREQKILDHMTDLSALKFEAEALWGEGVNDAFEDLHKVVRNLQAELWMFFWLKGAFAEYGETVDRSPERIEANDKVIYLTSRTDDEFGDRVNAAVQTIKDYFSPYLKH